MVRFQKNTPQINPYEVIVEPEAQRGIRSLSRENQRLVVEAIDALDMEPRPGNSKLLRNAENLRRLTIGDYRVIYGVHDGTRTVTVELVRPRKLGYAFLASFALTVRSKLYSR